MHTMLPNSAAKIVCPKQIFISCHEICGSIISNNVVFLSTAAWLTLRNEEVASEAADKNGTEILSSLESDSQLADLRTGASDHV